MLDEISEISGKKFLESNIYFKLWQNKILSLDILKLRGLSYNEFKITILLFS